MKPQTTTMLLVNSFGSWMEMRSAEEAADYVHRVRRLTEGARVPRAWMVALNEAPDGEPILSTIAEIVVSEDGSFAARAHA